MLRSNTPIKLEHRDHAIDQWENEGGFVTCMNRNKKQHVSKVLPKQKQYSRLVYPGNIIASYATHLTKIPGEVVGHA